MPQIPIYQSQVNLVPTTTTKVPQEFFTTGGAKVKETLNKVDKIAKVFEQLDTSRRQAKAENELMVELDKINIAAQKEEDVTKLPEYQARINKVVNEKLQNVPIGPARTQSEQSFMMLGYESFSKIRAGFRKKSIEQQQFQTYSNIEMYHDKAIVASSRDMFNINSEKAKLRIKQDRELNIISAEKADALLADVKSWEKDWQNEQIQALVNTDPDVAEKAVLKNIYGKFTAGERSDWLKVIAAAKAQKQARIKKEQALYKKEIEDTLQKSFFDETLTINDLERANKIPESKGGADRGLLETYKNKLFSRQKEKIENYVGVKFPESLDYINVIDDVLDKQADLIKARKILIDAYADGKITKEEGKILDHIKDIATSIEIKKERGLAKQWTKFQAAWSRFLEFRKNGYISNKPVEEQAKDLKEYINNISEQNSDPESILRDIIKRRQHANYPEYMSWEIGETHETSIGSVKMIGRDEDGMPIVELLNGNKSEN